MLLHWQGVAGEVLLLARCSGARFQPGSSLVSRPVVMVVMGKVMVVVMGKVMRKVISPGRLSQQGALASLSSLRSPLHCE